MKIEKNLLIIIILLMFAISGCSSVEVNKKIETESKEQKPAETPVIPEKSKTPEPQNDKATDEETFENAGVVIDTVIDVFKEPEIKSERVTQAIFNQKVTIIEEQEKWMKVRVVDGYEGWVKPKFITKDCSSLKAQNSKYKIIITGKTKKVYLSPKNPTTVKDVVMGTEFYSRDKVENGYEITLPGGSQGWVDENGTMQLKVDAKIPKTTANDFVTTARKFLGSGYLWGGVSSWGIDCSGFTYICGRINGVDLPRDADQQYKIGVEVAGGITFAKPGDFLFFSTNEDKKDISHEGIYLGNNQFIHASKSKGSVVIGLITETYFRDRLVGIKRNF